jgi:hypothetical protein
MQIVRSDEQSENAESPRVATLQPDSNVKLRSLVHWWKHNLGIVSIDEGTQIDWSDEHP